MGIIRDFLQRAAIDAVADGMAEQFVRHVSVAHSANRTRIDKELPVLLARARGFHRKTRLGAYGTSRLATRLQEGLITAGYTTELAKDIAKRIAVTLATDPNAKSA